MNLWKCDNKDCDRTCVGVGGAIGLRAIGWYFQRGYKTAQGLVGPVLLCPSHHPPMPTVLLEDHRDNDNPVCGVCFARWEAARYQAAMQSPGEFDLALWPDVKESYD